MTAAAMIVRHARERHELACVALDKAKGEERDACKAIDDAEEELKEAVDRLISGEGV